MRAGILFGQTYGIDHPEGQVPVQRCDLCQVYPDDEQAALEARRRVVAAWPECDGAALWCEDEPDEDGDVEPGEWLIEVPAGRLDHLLPVLHLLPASSTPVR